MRAEQQHQAARAKAEGKEAFGEQDYRTAVIHYSAAIQAAPRWHVLYVNRALCNRRLCNWDYVMSDCQTALELCKGDMKMRAPPLPMHAYLSARMSHDESPRTQRSGPCRSACVSHRCRLTPSILASLQVSASTAH